MKKEDGQKVLGEKDMNKLSFNTKRYLAVEDYLKPGQESKDMSYNNSYNSFVNSCYEWFYLIFIYLIHVRIQ